MRTTLTKMTLALAGAIALPIVSLAQDAAPAAAEAAAASTGGETQSWFQAFFWPKGPLLGNLIIMLLLLMSAVVMGFTLMLIFKYRRNQVLPEETRDEIEALLAEKKYREAIEFSQDDDSYLGQVVSAALGEASNGYAAMERAVEEAGDAAAVKILRPIEYLNVLGNISPMIGLFGTVFGMIVAFQALVASEGGADPTELAGGISTALVTTFWGLVVAIPALSAYSLIRNKIDAHCAEGILIVEELIAPFKPSGKKKSKSDRPRATPKPE
ncbi:MAG: MotA/TolQ/ExbB proton channel family protein [Planctomycetota bacterium]